MMIIYFQSGELTFFYVLIERGKNQAISVPGVLLPVIQNQAAWIPFSLHPEIEYLKGFHSYPPPPFLSFFSRSELRILLQFWICVLVSNLKYICFLTFEISFTLNRERSFVHFEQSIRMCSESSINWKQSQKEEMLNLTDDLGDFINHRK